MAYLLSASFENNQNIFYSSMKETKKEYPLQILPLVAEVRKKLYVLLLNITGFPKITGTE